VNVTGPAISQATQPPIKVPATSVGSTSGPASSADGEPGTFVSLLIGLINRNTVPLPTAPSAVTAKNKSKEAKSNEAKSNEAQSEKPTTSEVPQFTSNDPRDRVSARQQPVAATDEGKSAPRSLPLQGAIDPRLSTRDVAFGVRLTKNQSLTEDAGTGASGPLATDLSPTPDEPLVVRTAIGGGFASPSTPPHPEIEVLAGELGTSSKSSPPTTRPEAALAHTPALGKAIPPTPEQNSAGGNNSESGQKESAQPPVPKQNQSTLVRNDGHSQANTGTFDMSARQFEIARTAGPQSSREATNPSDLRKVASAPEINPAIQPQPARQISLKLTGPDSTQVDLQLTERAGKMQIAVRTPDQALAKSMQTDLNELVGRLENKGFKAEAWIPTSGRHAEAAAAPQQSSQGNSQNHPGRHSGGSDSAPQQQRQGQNESNQRQQARWKTQLDETSSIEETRMENL
jgi:hypothetical protein